VPVRPAAHRHSVGPSLLNNATDFGVQLFGSGFKPGAQLQLSDKATSAVIETLPTTFISSTEITALVPAGMPVPSGIQRELVARVINPGNPSPVTSNPPDIGHCQTDTPTSGIACHSEKPRPGGAGTCVFGDQRLTMFNDAVFLNPNSAAVVPDPYGACDDGTLCQSAGACAGIGSGACSPKLYVTPQQTDELWVYNTGSGQFIDKGGAPGIQGIPIGDNPFHVETLTQGGAPRAWVVNRFADAVSIVDPATDTEMNRVTGAALGIPGRLRMSTEIEFNRAGTRAYLSNQNLDEVLVLDISGGHRDAPVFVGGIDVGVNPRGMATNTADTRLYVANIQSADISVDIASGSAPENQVVATIGTRATDDIVGGRADGWEPFVISGRAPRGIVFSDDLQALFVTSIGPQTGPRPGVGQVGGAIINPTITVIDAASGAVVAHVALNGNDPDRFKCTDPELMALDDARGRLYVVPGQRHGRHPRHRGARRRRPGGATAHRATAAGRRRGADPGDQPAARSVRRQGLRGDDRQSGHELPLRRRVLELSDPARGRAGRVLQHQQPHRPAQRAARHRSQPRRRLALRDQPVHDLDHVARRQRPGRRLEPRHAHAIVSRRLR
jgi:DNA-binding beta-propeller fold protein YncE